MPVNLRAEARNPTKRAYTLSWQDESGVTHSAPVQSINSSHSGVGLRCPVEIPKGTTVYIEGSEAYPKGYAIIRHVSRVDKSFMIGLELDQVSEKAYTKSSVDETGNPYEFLQISPKAQIETIHRVYRFLAARYHPDNPDTGDAEQFLLLNQAYAVLSDPQRRARCDERLKSHIAQESEVLESVDFLDGVEGEMNRRLTVLSLLYRRCRTNAHSPEVSLLELESQMGFPREYLDFTIWYLRSKKYVKQEDNAALSLTSSGVDYVEENYTTFPLVRKLLNVGSHACGGARSTDAKNGSETHLLDPGELGGERPCEVCPKPLI